MPTCVIRDGPHICGEESVGVVGLTFGNATHEAPVCARHMDALNSAFHASAPIEAPTPEAPTVAVSATDSAGAGEKT